MAEVLITLGIIGVVAALTLPTLVANYKEKQIVSQLTKTYSMLSQAWMMMQNEYGSIDTWGLASTALGVDPDTGDKKYDFSTQSIIAERLKQYLKVSKSCELNKICDSRPTYYLNGKQINDNFTIDSSSDSPPNANFYLDDGTFIAIGQYSTRQTAFFPKGFGNIYVILPGHKKSIIGKTKYFFEAGAKGIIPEGELKGVRPSLFADSCNAADTSMESGRGCAAWVIHNKNLDYLHCPEKLGWDKASSCKD